MRRVTFLAPLMLAAACIVPLATTATATAATTVPVQVVNAYSYAAGHPFTETVCVDGVYFATVDTEHVSTPAPLTVGTHDFTVMGDNGTSCAGTPDLTTTVTIPTATSASIVLWWSPAGGLTASTYGDDPGCVAPGKALVVGRNVTTHVTNADFTAPSGYSVTNVGQTGSVMQEVAAGSAFGAGSLTATGSSTEIAPIPTFTAADGTRNTIYGYGGDDGAVGTFLVQEKISTCEVVTTTTIAPTTTVAATTTTTVPAATPATPVAADPTFTG